MIFLPPLDGGAHAPAGRRKIDRSLPESYNIVDDEKPRSERDAAAQRRLQGKGGG